jgi:pimeloyl-ACP methyl ester carboxylesterase
MPSPTIVLVHGAFGDASSWRPVFDRLVGDGHTVLAPPNPLRGIPYDASFTASVIDSTVTQVEGASHFLMRSQPDIVVRVIREAVVASAVNVAP